MSIDATATILDMHHTPIFTIRENVTRLMELHKITSDEDLAERAGVNQSTIWKLRKSTPPKTATLATLEAVATALRVAVWQLAMPNLAVGMRSVDELRGGVSRQGMTLCAILHALPPHSQQEMLTYAAFQATRAKLSPPLVAELDGASAS